MLFVVVFRSKDAVVRGHQGDQGEAPAKQRQAGRGVPGRVLANPDANLIIKHAVRALEMCVERQPGPQQGG